MHFDEDWIDEDGYPTDAALSKIEEWAWDDFQGCMEFVASLWKFENHATRVGDAYRFATGGWSGNEVLIGALSRNYVFESMYWYFSMRGGLHVYADPKSPTHQRDVRTILTELSDG